MIAAALALAAVVISVWSRVRELGGAVERHALSQTTVAAVAAGAALLVRVPVPDSLYLAAIASVCFAIAWIDKDEGIIPDILVAGLVVVALVAPFRPSPLEQVVGAAVLGLLFLAVRLAYFRWRKVEGLGLGDVKLAFAIGLMLGAETALLAVGLAAAMTAVWLVYRTHVPAIGGALEDGLQVEAPFGVGLSGALFAACFVAAAGA